MPIADSEDESVVVAVPDALRVPLRDGGTVPETDIETVAVAVADSVLDGVSVSLVDLGKWLSSSSSTYIPVGLEKNMSCAHVELAQTSIFRKL